MQQRLGFVVAAGAVQHHRAVEQARGQRRLVVLRAPGVDRGVEVVQRGGEVAALPGDDREAAFATRHVGMAFAQARGHPRLG
ncbi:MAG TPA: hypothetical protein PLF73_11600, partial [Luteimonas sp.]|nr:hypothetical protein [Luteimonas sp.]